MNDREPQSADLTANQRLAREIADKLIAEGLVDLSKHGELEAGLAEGTLGASDWRVLVELAADRERRRP